MESKCQLKKWWGRRVDPRDYAAAAIELIVAEASE
jgi:hypothetical protein